MSKPKGPARPANPQDVAAGIAARKLRRPAHPRAREEPLDHERLARSSRRATTAADRLLEELGDVLRNLDRKR
jgi:hypothetical protein